MTRIALLVSDVDGTLVTPEKELTPKTIDAVKRLRAGGVELTIASSRPPVGMAFLIKPLAITLPIGPFNGSSLIAPNGSVITQHLIPENAVRASVKMLSDRGIDIWLFTNDTWIVQRDDGKYVPSEQKTIRHDPVISADLAPYIARCCKIVGASADPEKLATCEADLQNALGDSATVIRSQTYYLDVTPPGQNKGTFVSAVARQLGLDSQAIAAVGDMHNDVSMFKVSGFSIAMGNASNDVKAEATEVTTSNNEEGFAGAVDLVLAHNAKL